jgi:dienelactone hydrolase
MIRDEPIEYTHDGTACEGHFAYDDSGSGRRAGVLVIHEWGGLGDYVKQRARMLAELGYVAFGGDIFGKGVRATTMEDCAKISAPFYQDRPLICARAQAALEQLRKHPRVDPNRIAAMGYCFGGLVVLEMARAGMPVNGVISFHGQFNTPKPAKSITTKVLVLHGASDPVTPPEEINGLLKEMEEAKADWEVVFYGGAKHTFTNFNLPTNLPGPAAYQEKADKKSWQAMKEFLAETVGATAA